MEDIFPAVVWAILILAATIFFFAGVAQLFAIKRRLNLLLRLQFPEQAHQVLDRGMRLAPPADPMPVPKQKEGDYLFHNTKKEAAGARPDGALGVLHRSS